MKNFLCKIMFVFLLVSLTIPVEACRFTVREIGFSLLSPTVYSLVIVDDTLEPASSAMERIRKQVKTSNVKVVVLNSESDKEHPYLKLAKAKGMIFPNAFLVSSDERICPLFGGVSASSARTNRAGEQTATYVGVTVGTNETYSLPKLQAKLEKVVLTSPIRNQILQRLSNTFAYIIRIPGRNIAENHEVDRLIRDDCERVDDIMSLMPKTVENPPQIISLSADDCTKEQILLWGLGLDDISEHPQVFIVYGRGRYMGNGLQISDVRNGMVYRYLAMVGADCECSLDREWMLGTQIPLLWNGDTRQKLARSLDFDVDNPLILAEMSRILSKEEPGGNSTITFTPETIDLDEVFEADSASSNNNEVLVVEEESKTAQVLWITIFVLVVIVGGVSIYILKRRREDY